MNTDIQKPNFFIIGAPKCGTTALSEYLRGHPEVFFSTPKELFYFNTDFSYWQRRILNENDYLNIFLGAGQCKAVGEGSVWYLYSQEAVPNILKFNPEAKFIVMLRNPVDMTPSLHAMFLKRESEDVENIRRAWKWERERKKERTISNETNHKKPLYYREVGKLGEQLERLYNTVSRDRVLVIFYDDFKQDPGREYRRVLEFLGLPDDGRSDFPVVNKRKKIASQTLQKMVKRTGNLKRELGINKGLGLLKSIKKKNVKEIDPEPLPAEFRQELIEYFRGDVEKLSKITGRNLSHWLK